MMAIVFAHVQPRVPTTAAAATTSSHMRTPSFIAHVHVSRCTERSLVELRLKSTVELIRSPTVKIVVVRKPIVGVCRIQPSVR